MKKIELEVRLAIPANGASADLLPTSLERRCEGVVIGQLSLLGKILDHDMIFGNREGLVDQDGFERIIVHGSPRGLLILQRE